MIRNKRVWRHYRVIGAVYAILFLALFSPWNGMGYDDTFYFSYLTSPAFDQDLRFENDFYLGNNFIHYIQHELSYPNDRGHIRNMFALGTSLMWLPFLRWFGGLRGWRKLCRGRRRRGRWIAIRHHFYGRCRWARCSGGCSRACSCMKRVG